MVLLGGAEIWTTCWADPAPTTFHWQESPFTTKKRYDRAKVDYPAITRRSKANRIDTYFVVWA